MWRIVPPAPVPTLPTGVWVSRATLIGDDKTQSQGQNKIVKKYGAIGESLIFAVPELISSHAQATETNKDCPLHGGGSGNAHTVTYKTEDT